eukprot:TRINITY_DN766_c0_g1_i6.p1 TRINITY_DN766_c0_g1~~TRINITY_DN766_c0_g1_i6.p1  ORF type:complete len:152 (-),score=25.63 TRINITY_DN766_c0_g1_i6:11-466(-)
MMDIATLQGAFGSLSMALNLSKKFLEMKSVAEAQGLVIALQSEILSAQTFASKALSDQVALSEEVRALKEEVARIKAWEEEKERYALIGPFPKSGGFVYALKEDRKGAEPPHWICTRCFEDGLKSILSAKAEIGRAVQQECRDRSRMPSSA